VNYVKEYLKQIQSGSIQASAKIKAVYARECAWMDDPTFEWSFDERAGLKPITFIEQFCRHSKGKWAGRKIELELFQRAAIQLAYGWIDKKGKRRFREVVFLVARKCGKSTITSGLSLFMLMADRESGSECYAVANKLDQAKLVFNEAANMRNQSADIKALTKKRQSDIYCPASMSTLKAIASDTKTMDGLNAHFFSLDEFHEARDSKVYDVMIQSQAAREQPLAWLISTNGYVRETFFDNKYNYSAHVAMWDEGFHDYRLLPLIYELDSRDEFDKPECWEKANPGIGHIKSYATLAENVEKAKRDPTFLPTVLTKDFNIPENTNTAWLTYDSAVNEKVVPIEFLKHSYAIGGCDLSAVRDLTCATLIIKKPNDTNIYVLQKYFLPQSRVDDVESGSKREAPYKLWAEQGWLHICEGATVDYHAVTQWFADMVEQHDIRPLYGGYDAALSGYWIEEMREYGFDFEKIRQGPYTWTYPLKQLGGLLEEHRVIYNNNPMLRWCMLNTGIKTLNKDGINTIQPVKVSETKRIDGLVSLLNAYTCYLNHEDEFNQYVR
jgi:phage terminase large subunit-like protein